jgi:hypothetical protein
VLIALIAAALAEPPEPPDGEVMIAAAASGLRAPPGCHVLMGEVTQRVRLGPMVDEEQYTFTGRLDRGQWRDLDWVTTADRKPGMSLSFADSEEGTHYPFLPPAFGALSEGTARDTLGAHGLLDALLSSYTPESASITAMYDFLGDQKVFAVSRLQTLEREGRQRDVSLYAMLDTQTLQPRSWTVRMDRGVRVEGVRISGVELDAAADAAGVPVSERQSGTVGLKLARLKLEQHILYEHTGDCGA